MNAPARLGPYEVVAELGRGAMGVVYRAIDRRLQREVALKVLLGSSDAAGLEDFVREARAAARLRHPGIVVVYGAEVIDGLRVVALELVQGGSLQQRLRSAGPLEPRHAAKLVADLAAAVEAAHREGIVHRDLKPANVLLERDGRPRLTDFGLARDERAGLRSASGDLIGTPAYMAPEQALGDVHRVGPQTDVWGLGALLFECLVGQPPFRGRTAQEIMRRIVEEPTRSPSDARTRRGLEALSDDLETICLTALAKDPARRYSSAAAMEEDLRRWLDGRPITARAPSRLRELLRAWRRHRASVGVAAVAAAVTALLVVVVPDVVGRGARARAHAAVLASVGRGEGRIGREKAVFELTKDRDPAAVPVLIEELAAATARMQALTRARLLEVFEPRDEEERARQARVAPLVAALDAAAVAQGHERLERMHVRALDEARRRLALREGRNRLPSTILSTEHRVALGDDALLRASVAAEALGRLGERAAVGPLARYLHVEEDVERVLVAVEALARLRDPTGVRAVLRMDERHDRGGACLNRAELALARELAGEAPPFETVTGLDHLDRGRLRGLLEDDEGQRADFDRAVALAPGDIHAWLNRAGVHIEDEAWSLALADLDRALALEPDEPGVLGSRAFVLAHRSAEDVVLALADADRAIALDPLDAFAYRARATARSKKGDIEGALADLARSIALEPAAAYPWAARARLRSEIGDDAGALEDADRALSIDPSLAGVWNTRAVVKQRRGDLEGALADLDKALELRPKDKHMLVNRAHVRRFRGDTAGALDDLAAALAIDERFVRAFGVRGMLRLDTGDVEGARHDLRAALASAPDDAEAWGLWGVLAVRIQDWAEARRAFERQIDLAPGDAIAHAYLARVRLRLGDRAGALAAGRRAVELGPRTAACWIILGEVLGAVGDGAGAYQALDQAVQLAPANAEAWRERGKYRLGLGDLEGALADASRAIELDPREAANYIMRGQAQRLVGDPGAALRDFERALELVDPRDAAGVSALRRIIDEVRRGSRP